MARKKSYIRGKRKKKSGRKQEPEAMPMDDMPDMPDPRSMDRMMADLTRLMNEQEFKSMEEANDFMEELMASGEPIPSPGARTSLDQAQGLIYDAWESNNARERVRLARKALEISPDCADAYSLLAEEAAKSLEEAAELYAKGVEVGARAIGQEKFEEYAGHFWGFMETRPYMRARAGLAGCLWELDQRQEALDHYRDMLRLNPGDNQGVRYVLMSCLLEEGLDGEAEELYQEYGDSGMANWLYTGALIQFRKEGAGRKANGRLKEALKANHHVPAYMLGVKRLPAQLPVGMGFGDESEAMYCVAETRHLWLQTKGALDWLRRSNN